MMGTPGDERPLGASGSGLTREDSMKNHVDEKEAIEQLRKAGWTDPEIERLRRLRRDYVEKKGEQAPANPRRSGFVHWLETLLQEGLVPSVPWWW
jgi:hypothetical protein